MRVLIVDDHAIVRRGMISLLQEHFKGVEIGEAGDAKEGLEAVQREKWDLAVVDWSSFRTSSARMPRCPCWWSAHSRKKTTPSEP